MKKVALLSILIISLLSILIISMPTVNAADRDSTPAPVVSAAPTPAKATPTPAPSVAAKNVTTELTKVRSLIAAKNFSAALTSLQAADKTFPNNADINNLLGYSARNLKQYKPAATYYAKALKIDPKHLGALEYQGELFMLTKKTSDAKKNLAKLKSLCGVNCEEYLDLKKAIGNK
jgi:Flp pilus assembly protein TadD